MFESINVKVYVPGVPTLNVVPFPVSGPVQEYVGFEDPDPPDTSKVAEVCVQVSSLLTLAVTVTVVVLSITIISSASVQPLSLVTVKV